MNDQERVLIVEDFKEERKPFGIVRILHGYECECLEGFDTMEEAEEHAKHLNSLPSRIYDENDQPVHKGEWYSYKVRRPPLTVSSETEEFIQEYDDAMSVEEEKSFLEQFAKDAADSNLKEVCFTNYYQAEMRRLKVALLIVTMVAVYSNLIWYAWLTWK